MNKLSYEGLKTDLEIRKKLTELLQMKDELEKNDNLNPIEEQQNKLAVQKVDNLIGIIRYNAIDKLGIFSKDKSKIEKDFPNMAEGVQAHEQYPDLLVGRQPKLGEKQKEIIGKSAFGPDAPKVDVTQKRKDQSFEEANIGGEHVGQVFQLSKDNNKPLARDEKSLDFNPSASDDSQEEQELTAGEIKLLAEIDKYLTGLEQ